VRSLGNSEGRATGSPYLGALAETVSIAGRCWWDIFPPDGPGPSFPAVGTVHDRARPVAVNWKVLPPATATEFRAPPS